jgi:hypothetical protein
VPPPPGLHDFDFLVGEWRVHHPVSGHWEQALSYDAGKTWDTNWIMDFQRIS